MTSASQTCLPTTTWFLSDQSGRPLGQIYEQQIPEVGLQLGSDSRYPNAVVTSFEELRPTCAMRRFKVVLSLDE